MANLPQLLSRNRVVTCVNFLTSHMIFPYSALCLHLQRVFEVQRLMSKVNVSIVEMIYYQSCLNCLNKHSGYGYRDGCTLTCSLSLRLSSVPPGAWKIQGKYVGGYKTIKLLVSARRISWRGVVCCLKMFIERDDF